MASSGEGYGSTLDTNTTQEEQNPLKNTSSSSAPYRENSTSSSNRLDISELSSLQPLSKPTRRASSIEYLKKQCEQAAQALYQEVVEGERRCTVEDHGGTATVRESVFNLTKNVVGSSMLAIPGGIAGYGDSPSALIPAIICILVLAVINAYYFSMIGRVCAMTSATTYRQAWERSMGGFSRSNSSTHDSNSTATRRTHGWIVAWVCTLKAGFGNLAGSMILADSFRELAEGLGWYYTRTQVLLVVTVLLLWPLCMLKHIRVLAPFSVLGIVAVGLTVLAMGIRFFDGTYALQNSLNETKEEIQETSLSLSFVHDLSPSLQPQFGTTGAQGFVQHPGKSLLLIGMLATAYVAHYNAPRFYVELQCNTLQRYNRVVTLSYTLGAAVYVLVAVIGFSTFGGHAAGFVLENYSTRDVLAVVCRVAVDVSILLSYPLVFVGFRDGVLDVLKVPPEKQTVKNLNLLSTGLLVVVTILAVEFRNLGLVLSFGGATLATAVIYIFPTLMFRSCVRHLVDDCGCLGVEKIERAEREVVFSMGLMGVGIVLGCLGALIALGVI